ncbi:transcription factor SPT20 homolog isoform X8 [Mytilus californianus]|uniref:transcription factor SPT20 homolog isoform X8 n=1 Tax=Mytilus californianus TaxID=6549 RepID=UPI002246A4D0|nr:transcription factor SPT20 homolog isoform X8 [Mytilus californianus]
MAFISAPTLCEITYDLSEEEKSYTPFRYQCRSAPGTRANVQSPSGYSEVTNYSLPTGLTVTYYEYLRSLYDSRIHSANKKAYRHSSAHPSSASHVGTSISGHTTEGSRRTGRPKTALPYVSQTLPTVPQSPGREAWGDGHSQDDKLVWSDALNKWLPENQLNSRPYVSFVGTAPTVEKLYTNLREHKHEGVDGACCDRYDDHMKSYEQKAKHGMAPKQLHPENSFINRLMALRKKEALRKKAQEQLEQRRQRKAHSSPLHSSINERRQKVRFQMPRSTKVSPRSPRDSAVKEDQDFNKQWDDEANMEDVKKEEEITPPETEVKGSSSSETDGDQSSKEVNEESKPLEKSQSELDRENAKRLLAELEAKKKKEKQEQKKMKKAPKKDTEVKPKEVRPSRSKTKPVPKVKTKNKDHHDKEEKQDLDETGTLISEDTTHSVATIEDTKTGPLSLTVSADKTSQPEESPSPQPKRRTVVKKVFVPKVKPKVERQDSTPTPELEEEKSLTPELEEAEIEETPIVEEPALPVVELDEPPLPDPSLYKCKDSKSSTKNKSILKPILKLEQKLKKQRQFKRDTSYEEELRRQEEAERRRQKQMEMLEKMKNRNKRTGGEAEAEEEARNFDNYGFLAKYCIFNKLTLDAYRRTFDSVDEERKGWIKGVDVMIGLRGINQKISYEEEEYLYRVMEITGYNISQGADFKLFAVMAALSLKISSLDSWMRNMIGSMDFKMLDTKMYMCKKLWECNVDPDTNKISIDQLCIELRAGGISQKHEIEVREKLGHLKALDLLDFLTYIPLFILIHESVVDNPFDDRRDK